MKGLITFGATVLFGIAAILTSTSFAGVAGHRGLAERPFGQQNLIGTVTAIDAAAGKLTVRPDSGIAVTFVTNGSTSLRRVPPGETSLTKAETITFADIKTGDRVLVPGGVTDANVAVKQVIVMAREAIAVQRDEQRSEWQARGVGGRITALDANKRQIIIQTRGRTNAEAVTVAVPENAKILRYAEGSLRSEDAKPGTFADMRIGDQVRILGDRNADGGTITATEIVSGTIVRTFGTITNINSAANEVTVKNEQTGQTTVVVLAPKSVVRRLPPEVAQNLAARREQRQQQRQARAESTGARTEQRRPPARTSDQQRPRGMQQLLESQPAINIGELKAGDAILVTGLQGTDPNRVSAATAIVGDAEVMRMLRPQRRNGNMSPGLPGDVGGGNVPTNDEP